MKKLLALLIAFAFLAGSAGIGLAQTVNAVSTNSDMGSSAPVKAKTHGKKKSKSAKKSGAKSKSKKAKKTTEKAADTVKPVVNN